MQTTMTLADLATAMSEAFQSAATVEERWPAAAYAAVEKIVTMLPPGAALHVGTDGALNMEAQLSYWIPSPRIDGDNGAR